MRLGNTLSRAGRPATTTLIAFMLSVAGQAQAQISLSLSTVRYEAKAGETVRLAVGVTNTTAFKRGRALQSSTWPDTAQCPFATTDTQGNAVIAVPILTAPRE